jgi:regulation of enolase protein 1 (concanavalin A-like superfamily)
MIKSLLTLSLLSFSLFANTPLALEATWQKSFGGSKDDVAKDIIATEDGGAIMIGTTRSKGAGRTDIYAIKLDAKGEKLWEKTYGGLRKEEAAAITQLQDGNFIIVGATKSYGKGGYDYFIIKIDKMGNRLWAKTAGGTAKDEASAVIATDDGGMLVVGSSKSSGKGSYNYYAIKLNSEGKRLWEQTVGGKDWDLATDVAQMEDGGFLLVGKSESFGDNGYDGYIVKLSNEGKFLWEKTFGGKKEDSINAIAKGSDGGFLLVGKTKSYKDKKGDSFIIKLDKAGKKQLVKTYGNIGKDRATAVTALKDGGYAIAGSSREMSHGREDFILIIVDKDAKVMGSNHYGGKKEDIAYAITQLQDGSIMIAGDTKTYGNGGMDSFVVQVP